MKFVTIFLWISLVYGETPSQPCTIVLRVAFCNQLCDASHYYDDVRRIQIGEPSKHGPREIDLQCLSYFPNVTVSLKKILLNIKARYFIQGISVLCNNAHQFL